MESSTQHSRELAFVERRSIEGQRSHTSEGMGSSSGSSRHDGQTIA
jgi:hypothetical protein